MAGRFLLILFTLSISVTSSQVNTFVKNYKYHLKIIHDWKANKGVDATTLLNSIAYLELVTGRKSHIIRQTVLQYPDSLYKRDFAYWKHWYKSDLNKYKLINTQ
ncbi:MAG TPA: hypothetical protein PLW44_10980 [Chitinophagales bacterium]|nr:hypothetical protein [Chitinophagales bacterium]